eukprot:6620088-Pyramimonas_sp.AAC.1
MEAWTRGTASPSTEAWTRGCSVRPFPRGGVGPSCSGWEAPASGRAAAATAIAHLARDVHPSGMGT